MFSSRLDGTTERNRLSLALDDRRAAGLPIADLTLSNPTAAGITYPPDLLKALGDSRGLCYEPSPFGLAEARRAVSAEYARQCVPVPPNRIVLTASTSEAYSLLFKLLGNPGDAILAPRPSYPLVEHLAHLDGLRVEYYDLEYHGRWTIDVGRIGEALGDATRRFRAVVLVSPNNPTGSVVDESDLREIARVAGANGVPLIADEVFCDYPIEGPPPRSVLRQDDVLTFALGGLSKSAGLPQLKLGWIAMSGPRGHVEQASERLEVICDAYLSVGTPVQAALPELLARSSAARDQIRSRVSANHSLLKVAAEPFPACAVLPVEAGWYAIVQIPAVRSEEDLVLDILNRRGVLVHPGYFFDFQREAYLIVSLLPPPQVFASAVRAMLDEAGGAR